MTKLSKYDCWLYTSKISLPHILSLSNFVLNRWIRVPHSLSHKKPETMKDQKNRKLDYETFKIGEGKLIMEFDSSLQATKLKPPWKNCENRLTIPSDTTIKSLSTIVCIN